MFNSVAINVVIGLVFIYLLYSLLATVISELIATMFGLRGRNLKEAIDRMLNDEKPKNWLQRLWDTVKLMKSPNNPVVNSFYEHPEIKYLGSSGLFKIPSNFKADSFSKALLNILFGEGKVTGEMIEDQINKLMVIGKDKDKKEVVKEIDKASADFIRGLWAEADGDVDKFKVLIENWFNRTMEHTLEWYKRKTRAIALILGFLLAWFFNADTFVIVKNLSTDKDAREQLVSMANAYIESEHFAADTARFNKAKQVVDTLDRFDSLLAVSRELQADIMKANSLLGTGCRLPDSVKIFTGRNSVKTSQPEVESAFLSLNKGKKSKVNDDVIIYSCSNKWCYFFWLLGHHFFGFLVTAIAITLGAPFWFDLLSKVMSLKTSKKDDAPAKTQKTETAT